MVVLQNCRCSFVKILRPESQFEGQNRQYSMTVLLPKSDVVGKQNLDNAIESAKQTGLQTKFGGQMPPALHIPIYDGDGARQSGEQFGPECKGHWVFTVRANEGYPPQVVDQQFQPVIDESMIYSGMYAHVAIEPFPYASHGRKGIGLSLIAVQKSADGEPLGATPPPAQEIFKGLSTQQPATQQQPFQALQQQQYTQAPVQQQYQQQPQQAPAPPNPYQDSFLPPVNDPNGTILGL